MKRVLKISAAAVVFAAALLFASCEKNETPLLPPEWAFLTFEAMPPELVAGPTSYGENLYSTYTGDSTVPGCSLFTTYDYADVVTLGINEIWGAYDFWNGGVAVSNWNIMNSPAGKADDWWRTYENQCSVYDRESVSGQNLNAGHSGSNFAVVTGSQSDYSDNGQISLTNGDERIFDHMYVCNSAYTYGVIVHGDSFSDNGTLSSQKGYFALVVYGYKAGASEPVASDKIILADYRDGKSFVIDRWTPFNLTNIKRQPVNRLVFEFEGSDMHPLYGLNTPKYVCIDDICMSYSTF